jgi:hypothetical protein
VAEAGQAALAAKLTMLVSSPAGWAIAAGAAIAGGIALINKAERDHEKALRDKVGAYQQNQAEGAKLAKEYRPSTKKRSSRRRAETDGRHCSDT